ncbi:MAG: PAS domain S-box protein [Deinococcota bacterium]
MNTPPFSVDENSSAFYAAIWNSADVGMCVTDIHARFVMVNDAYCQTYGYARDELIGQVFTMVLPEDQRQYAYDIHKAYLEGASESAGEWTILRKDGTLRIIWVTAARVISPAGERFKVTTVTDITERKENEAALEQTLKDKTLLLKEVHHRVKNNLQVIGSLLYLQSRKLAADNQLARQAFEESRLRVSAMSAVHELIYENDTLSNIGFANYLNNLIELIVKSLKITDVAFKVVSEEYNVTLDKAVPLGLICNELITNTIKYGFPKDVVVHPIIWVRLEQTLDNTLSLIFEDNGIGLPEGFDPYATDTLGMSIIMSLTQQLAGTIQFARGSKTDYGQGLKVTLTFQGD